MLILTETKPLSSMVASIRDHDQVLLSGDEVSILHPEIAYRSLLRRTEQQLRRRSGRSGLDGVNEGGR